MSQLYWNTVGARLRRRRNELRLSLRDVETASRLLAQSLENEEFGISRAQLSKIEAHDALPNLFRLHSLSQIYGVDFDELASWYGVCPKSRAKSASANEPGWLKLFVHFCGQEVILGTATTHIVIQGFTHSTFSKCEKRSKSATGFSFP